MSKFEDIKELLSTAFNNLSDVLEIEMRSEFSVIDLKDYGRQSFIIINIQFDDNTFTINFNGNETVITDFDSTKLFNISNAKMVGFIPIDGKKGLLRKVAQRCDFVFFDENDFCFVEFKLDAISEQERAIRSNTKGATDQLKATISWFNYKLSKQII
jgi:vacuolar-type H+-ATPase subunit I/STV1